MPVQNRSPLFVLLNMTKSNQNTFAEKQKKSVLLELQGAIDIFSNSSETCSYVKYI